MSEERKGPGAPMPHPTDPGNTRLSSAAGVIEIQTGYALSFDGINPQHDFLDEVHAEYRRLMAPLLGTAIPVNPGESPDDACARVKAEVYADAERTVRERRERAQEREYLPRPRTTAEALCLAASPPDPFADAANMVAIAEAKTGHGIVIGGPLGPRCLTHDCAVVRNAEDTAWVCVSTAEAPDATTCTRDRDVLTASGRALDLYGARVGVYRQKGESDAGFRASILCRKDREEQTRERVVTALVSGSPLHPSGCGFADPTKRCVVCELASQPWADFEAESRVRHLGSEAAAYGRLHAGAIMRGRTYRDAFGQLGRDGTRRGGR